MDDYNSVLQCYDQSHGLINIIVLFYLTKYALDNFTRLLLSTVPVQLLTGALSIKQL